MHTQTINDSTLVCEHVCWCTAKLEIRARKMSAVGCININLCIIFMVCLRLMTVCARARV